MKLLKIRFTEIRGPTRGRDTLYSKFPKYSLPSEEMMEIRTARNWKKETKIYQPAILCIAKISLKVKGNIKTVLENHGQNKFGSSRIQYRNC